MCNKREIVTREPFRTDEMIDPSFVLLGSEVHYDGTLGEE